MLFNNLHFKVMKKLLALLLGMLVLEAAAQDKPELKVLENANQRLIFALHLQKDQLQFMKVSTPQGMFSQLGIADFGYTNQSGDPKLPALKKLIEVPMGADCRLEIRKMITEEYRLSELGVPYTLIPAQRSVSKSEDAAAVPFQYNEATYSRNEFLQTDPVKVEVLGMMRSLRMARLEVMPVQYNPVSGKIRVITDLEVIVHFDGADPVTTRQLREDKFSPFFEASYSRLLNYKEPQNKDQITKYPVKYVIVADPMFQTALQPFVQWKTKKGFTVVEAYTNNPAVGSTTTTIKNYIQGLYNAGTSNDPAPSFVLFVGDVAQVPSYNMGGHVTDLYYCEYTGDYIPEIYYGRFSATSVNQLQPQIDKTLQYEQYTMPDPTFLDEVVMIAGVDGSMASVWGNGQINYGTTEYFNASNNLVSHTYLYPASGSSAALIRADVSKGVCFANYTAHGGSSGWSDPSFSVSDVASLTNTDKYPLMVGNCCLTNKFDDTECFGEALLRANGKGALGYIGGSNVTYWDEDYWFGVGYRSSIVVNPTYSAVALGAYDCVFHTHGEPFAKWFMTQAQYMVAGNLAVTQGGGGAQYYWEIYHLMGDPSLMVYFSVPPAITATYNPLIPLGSTSFTIQTDPYAYAAVSMGGVLLGAALADSLGNVVVPLSGAGTPGTADVVITAQNRAPHIATVVIANPAGPYVLYTGNVVNDPSGNNDHMVDYAENISLDITLRNFGQATANSVSATLATVNTNVVLTDNNQSWGNISSNTDATQTGAYSFSVAGNIPDQEVIPFTLAITDNAGGNWSSNFNLTANAPVLGIGSMTIDDASGNNNGCLDEAENVNMIIYTLNDGHADALNAAGTLTTSTPQYITINTATHNFGTLSKNSGSNATFSLTVASAVPDTAVVKLTYTVNAGAYSVIYHYFLPLGEVHEDWETGDFNRFDWQQAGEAPWVISSVSPYEGIYCAHSGAITDNQTSILFIELQVLTADTISFWKRVSSEENYDFMTFQINGVEMGSWSGEVAWSKSFYTVGTGDQTFKWSYEKDYSLSSGSDRAWIDYILFPPVVNGFAGLDKADENGEVVLLCSPNPASGMVMVYFTLSGESSCSLSLHDQTGRQVKKLLEENLDAGTYPFAFNAAEFSPGVYFLTLTSGQSIIQTQKLIIIK